MGDNNRKQQTRMDRPEKRRGVGDRIAPAVALLLTADSVYAIDAEDDDPDAIPVSEPTTLGLLGACAAVGGIAAYVRRKQRK